MCLCLVLNRLNEIIANIRNQLDNLLHKKTAYGASTAKKRDAIANMAREEIREKVNMVASADYLLQKRYMSTPPRKIDVYNDGEFDEEVCLSLT